MKKTILTLTIILVSTLIFTGCNNQRYAAIGKRIALQENAKLNPIPKDFVHSGIEYSFNEEKKLLVVRVDKKIQGEYSQKEIFNTVMHKTAEVLKSNGYKYIYIPNKFRTVPFYLSGVKNISNLCFENNKAKNEDFRVCSVLNSEFTKNFAFIGLKEPIMHSVTFEVERTLEDSKSFLLTDVEVRDITNTSFGTYLTKKYKL